MIKTQPILYDKLVTWLDYEKSVGNILPNQEKRFSYDYNRIKNAALFWFPKVTQELDFNEDKISWYQDNIYLPFPVVAIEDRASLFILVDSKEKDREILRGANHTRAFVELIPLSENITDKTAYREADIPIITTESNSFIIVSGSAKITTMVGKRWMAEGHITHVMEVRNKKLHRTIEREQLILSGEYEKYIKGTLRNFIQAIQELCCLCDPDYFILEKTPVKENKFSERKNRKNRIKLSKERPIYTILRAKEIRDTMGLELPHGSPRPHDRRAHMRRLMSEKFTYKRGQTILIPSCWVGPHENIKDGHRYKVILDH